MDKEFLKKCWENKRWHSFIVLLIWIIGLSLLFGITSIINSIAKPTKSNTRVNNTTIHYEDKLNDLLSKDYTFKIIVTKEETQILFEGTKKEGEIIGYKQDENGLMKYKIKENKIYEVLVMEEIETTKLYENVEENFIDITKLINLIKKTKEIEKQESLHKYTIKQEDKNVQINVYDTEKRIEKMEINTEEETYEFHFSPLN